MHSEETGTLPQKESRHAPVTDTFFMRWVKKGCVHEMENIHRTNLRETLCLSDTTKILQEPPGLNYLDTWIFSPILS